MTGQCNAPAGTPVPVVQEIGRPGRCERVRKISYSVIVSLYGVKWPALVIRTYGVLCEVGTELLRTIRVTFDPSTG
jgi:hypothetical protein